MKDPTTKLLQIGALKKLKGFTEHAAPHPGQSNVENLCGMILVAAGLLIDATIEEISASGKEPRA